RGVPQVEVTFDIDANGILNVSAKDKATGKEQSVQITASTNLSSDEVDRLVQEAKSHEAEDSKRRDLVDARNAADQMIYSAEKALSDLGDKVPVNDRGQIEQTIEDLKSVKDSNDLDRIKSLTEQLQQASHVLTQQMYQQASANGAGPDEASPNGSAPAGEADEDDVVEGEFRQV
ncbi:MAG: Hsp70 family protein, partial [Caldilineaceae bacterium]|nr:Hsp70 family protein [Caldilineaceae bacterium]